MAIFLGGALVGLLFRSVALALAGGLVTGSRNAAAALGFGRTILMGAALGAAMAGLNAVARSVAPSLGPSWGDFEAASMFWPILGGAVTPLIQFLTQTLLLLVIFCAFTWKPRWSGLLVLIGLVIAGASSLETISSWLIAGLASGIVLWAAYTLVLRHQPKLLVTAIATLAIFSIFRDGLGRAYPGAFTGSILAIIVIGFAAWVWVKLAARPAVPDLLELKVSGRE